MSYFGANGRAENNGSGSFDVTETENVIYMDVKDVKKYIYTPGEAVDNDYIECSLYSQPVQGQGGQHMEMSFLQALFPSNIEGSLELVSGNQWEYHVVQKVSAYKNSKCRLPLKIFFLSSIGLCLLTPWVKDRCSCR